MRMISAGIRLRQRWPGNGAMRDNIPETAARSPGGGNLTDEIADMPFDFSARQAVARLGVRKTEIAADDEGAQPLAGQGDSLHGAGAAAHLHGGLVAPALENRARP